MTRRAISLYCTIFAFLLWISLPMQAQSKASNSNSTSTSSSQSSKAAANGSMMMKSSPQQKQQLSKMAVHALRFTDQARQAVIDHNQDRARTDVNQAISLLNQVKTKLHGNSNAEFVPIYAELEQTSFLQPVLAAKNKTGKEQASQTSNSSAANNHSTTASNSSNTASKNEKQGEESAANKQSNALPQSDQPPNNTPEVVNWVEGGYSYINLNVNDALEHLQTAKQDLANHQPGKADLELARAQGSVDAGTVEVNMPLVRARENLSLARDEANKGNIKQAKTELKAATDALKQYAQDTKAPHASEAKDLSSKIESAEGGSTQVLKINLNHWWNQVADWTGEKSS